MQKERTLLLMLLILLTISTIRAENYYFKQYGKENGLSHQTVHCSFQDRFGFMWFGTKSGLNRFDGNHFKVYVSDPENEYSLINNTVLCITEGPDGLLWIGTSEGLCVYDPARDSFSPFSIEGIGPDRAIDRLTFDKQGNLWVLTFDGIYCIDIGNKDCKFYHSSDFFIPSSIVVTVSGSIWILSVDGYINLFNPQKDTFTSYSILTEEEKAQHIHLYHILECGNGDLLITTDRVGVRRFSPNSAMVETIFTKDQKGEPIYIHTALRRDKNEFWFGTETGVHIYNLKTCFTDHLQKSYHDPYSLSDNAVHMLYKDREEGIWVGTFFGGINYLAKNNTLFEKYLPLDKNGNIHANVIREIHPDKEGNLWIGTEDGGLCFYNTHTKTFKALTGLTWNGRPVSKNIQCLLVEEDVVWVGTFDKGIYLIDPVNNCVIDHFSSEDPSSGLFVNGIVCIRKLSSGEILVGTMGGLYRFTGKEQKFQIIPGLNWGLIHSIYEDTNHTVWVVTLGRGVFTIDPHEYCEDIELKSLPFIDKYVTTIFEDSQKRLWFGTDGNGILQYNKEKEELSQILPKPDYTGQIIYQIIEDGMNRLWITTSNGLLRYNPEQKTFDRFTTQNGLPIDQFIYNSGYQDRIGNIYFGSLKGLVVFSPENFTSIPVELKVYFTRFQLFNKEINANRPESPLKKSILFARQINLPYDQSTFSIDFAIPTYDISQNVWYRYKLEGVDKEWTIREGSRTLYYTKLPPGRYTLLVQASTTTELWDGEISSLSIHVRPPFWRLPLAYLFYAFILIATFAFLFIRYQRRKKKKESIQLNKLQDEKQKEILQAKISFFTNITHEIRTPLTLIMGSLNRITRSDDKKLSNNENIQVMSKNAQRLLDLVNQLLDFRKIESSNFLVNFVKTDIIQLLKETYSRFTPIAETKNIQFTLHISPDNCTVIADKEALTKIVSNMLNNAIKFSNRKVEVTLQCLSEENNPTVRIRINNDGERIPTEVSKEIFKPFVQHFGQDTKAPIKGSGLGLPLAKSLAELHNGLFYLDESVVEMNSFVLELPFDRQNTFEITKSSHRVDHTNKNRYNILLVDDEIELRQFVLEELAPQYNIFVADNGKQALELLDTHIISLVITDLMMPVMDGIELCKSIKTNIKYCHIPVLVLTAKASLQDHIDVLHCQADAYIEKPFSTEHLLAQASNLLANRELIRSTFIRSPHAHLSSIASNNIDEKFINKLNEYIMTHLADPGLSVELLAEYLNMSASTLYRKVKAMTSLPPTDFIRLCRLKKASEMLAEGSYRISEVAENVGFCTTSYFTSCFMKQFGITPSDFIKKNNVQ